MIHIHLPPTRQPPKTTQSGMLTNAEFQRRTAIIKQQIEGINYHVGELVRPVDDKTFQQRGFYRMNKISKNWSEYKAQFAAHLTESQVEWPASDLPYLVSAVCLKTSEPVIATANYFRKVTDADNEQVISSLSVDK